MLPIYSVLTEDAWVFLWTTSALLPLAFPMLQVWGLTYKFTMTWHKHIGPKPYGYPYYNAEYIVVGGGRVAEARESKGVYLVNKWKHPRRDDPSPQGLG